MGALALIEILDRDGSVRHAQKVLSWPLRVGRSLDNDLVLDDPHVAGHHFQVNANDDGVYLTVGDTVNGVGIGSQRLAAGERWQAAAAPSSIVVGRSHLRLRLAEHPLPAEVPLRHTRVLAQRVTSIAWLVLVNLLLLVFATYLASDPEPLPRTLARDVMSGVALLFAWCGAWTLLSKLFTRQGHFAWHVRVLLTAAIVWQLLDGLMTLAAFAFSWPWLTGHSYVLETAVAAAALYFHLQAVEPHRPLVTRAFAAAAFVVGLGLTLWGNWQRSESTSSELYQAALFPPSFRVAKTVDTDHFLEGLEPLEASLDAKAKKPADEDDAGGGEEEE
ncbi:FHA domain-containing protein [Piscinibacter gummiphilus]|uniref:Uncharacterized protein n=1 Tax=Piscinibacter gummiphilus TaxID=946333 RepID=A0A1W6LH34_9BURK|nr:FHA domain-containing protein [Piscinibacter gummiphilus]ARN23507.1 hypothetical protein A4W93_28435 [Piscinibacter gummiphilus]ATU68215.1 hypothetical protein CPZ87_28570 [Piscinibacter gummiphilus]GLS97538.1 hypothetical protein GCM10007918_48300 [Piscinibacter gummiphilus]